MPRVSKNKISEEVREKILHALFLSFARIHDNRSISELFENLLTSTERIMIAKRLAAALLLIRCYEYRGICSLLKMSHVTVNQVKREIEKGGKGYQLAAHLVGRDSGVESILKKIDRFLSHS